MSDGKRESKVVWPNVSMTGGDLDEENRQRIHHLVDDFGIALEREAETAKVDRFVFPLFREFDLVAVLTASAVLLTVAPGRGMPTQNWLDWQAKSPIPTPDDLTVAVRRDLGWERVSTLSFPRTLLQQEPGARIAQLHSLARGWVAKVVQEAERQARIVKLNPIFRGRDFLIEDDLCFVLIPFREPFLRLYSKHIKPTLVSLGLRVLKADDLFTPTVIVEDIWEFINRARVIVADVTGRNPNVFYELGIAHTVGKDVIVLTQNEGDVPFDVGHLRHFTYVDNETGWGDLEHMLESAARAVLAKQPHD